MFQNRVHIFGLPPWNKTNDLLGRGQAVQIDLEVMVVHEKDTHTMAENGESDIVS